MLKSKPSMRERVVSTFSELRKNIFHTNEQNTVVDERNNQEKINGKDSNLDLFYDGKSEKFEAESPLQLTPNDKNQDDDIGMQIGDIESAIEYKEVPYIINTNKYMSIDSIGTNPIKYKGSLDSDGKIHGVGELVCEFISIKGEWINGRVNPKAIFKLKYPFECQLQGNPDFHPFPMRFGTPYNMYIGPVDDYYVPNGTGIKKTWFLKPYSQLHTNLFLLTENVKFGGERNRINGNFECITISLKQESVCFLSYKKYPFEFFNKQLQLNHEFVGECKYEDQY